MNEQTPFQLSPDAIALKPGAGPLYAQVRDLFARRVLDGVWAPGDCLPSEMELAAELGVSQGTVRKALDAMAAQNLVVRRQGRGTFIAQHDEERILFQFFKLGPDVGEPVFPTSVILSADKRAATPEEAEKLQIPAGAKIAEIKRVRMLRGRKVISESIVLPLALFPGFSTTAIPNNLYRHYATRFGVTAANAQEKLKAITLGDRDAALLEVEPETPALRIDRVTYGINGIPIEWRIGLCLTDEFHYTSELV